MNESNNSPHPYLLPPDILNANPMAAAPKFVISLCTLAFLANLAVAVDSRMNSSRDSCIGETQMIPDLLLHGVEISDTNTLALGLVELCNNSRHLVLCLQDMHPSISVQMVNFTTPRTRRSFSMPLSYKLKDSMIMPLKAIKNAGLDIEVVLPWLVDQVVRTSCHDKSCGFSGSYWRLDLAAVSRFWDETLSSPSLPFDPERNLAGFLTYVASLAFVQCQKVDHDRLFPIE